MAGSATAQNLGVINRQYWRKQCRRMAVLTNIGCLNVGRILAERVSTVVTAYAVGSDIGVIEIRSGNPGRSDVAIVTGIR